MHATCWPHAGRPACLQGGSTQFDFLSLAVKPAKGKALLFFPSYSDGRPDERWVHRCCMHACQAGGAQRPAGTGAGAAGAAEALCHGWLHGTQHCAPLPCKPPLLPAATRQGCTYSNQHAVVRPFTALLSAAQPGCGHVLRWPPCGHQALSAAAAAALCAGRCMPPPAQSTLSG